MRRKSSGDMKSAQLPFIHSMYEVSLSVGLGVARSGHCALTGCVRPARPPSVSSPRKQNSCHVHRDNQNRLWKGINVAAVSAPLSKGWQDYPPAVPRPPRLPP